MPGDSISYRSEGRAHLVDDKLSLEWVATRTTERVALSGIGTDVDHSPMVTREIRVSWIAEARLRGGWWMPHARHFAEAINVASAATPLTDGPGRPRLDAAD